MKNKKYLNPQPQFIFRLMCILFLLTAYAKSSFGQIVVTNPTSPWTVPAGATSVKVEVWGGGGAGGGSQNAFLSSRYGGGGGGGGYSVSTLTVSGGQNYTVTIGAGGTGADNTNGTAGGTTTFTGPGGTVSANGGGGGVKSTAATGGAAGTGNTRNGGTGGTGTSNGAGGGGGAGSAANGSNGANTGTAAGGAGTPNVAPYKGGNGGAAQTATNGDGNAGADPAGGGSGGKSNTAVAAGGSGGDGQVVLTYTLPAPTISSFGASSGCIGSTITINGNYFTGATAVTIGGTAAPIVSNSGTIIVATIGSGTTGTVAVTTPSGTVTSGSTFTVNTTPSISGQPSAQTICSGLPVTFSVTGTGVPTPTYQWKKAGVVIAGATNSTFNIGSVSTGDAASYTVVLTNSCNALTSNGAALTVNSAPSVSVDPVSQTKCTGTSVTFSVTATGTPAPTYQWRKGGVNISGATTASYNIASVVAGSAANYDVVVTNTCGTAASTAATLTVNVSPTANSSSNTPVCSGNSLNLSSNSTGVTYQWSGPVSFSSTLQSPSRPNALTTYGGTYTLTVTDIANGCTASTTTGATVNATPATSASNNSAICAGATLNLTGGPGSQTTYSWVGPNGYTNSTQSPSRTNAQTTYSGNYTLTVTSSAGCSASASTVATVNAVPAASASSDAPGCTNGTLNLSASGGGTYLWSGPNGFSSTSQNPSISSFAGKHTGDYTVTVTQTGCSATATTAVSIKALPVPAPAVNNSTVCPNVSVNLTSGTNTIIQNNATFAIPDNNATGIGSPIVLSGFLPTTLAAATIKSVNFSINHTYDGDLAIYLVAPNGTQVLMVNHRGSSGNNFTNTTIVNSGGANGNVSAGSSPFTGTYNTENAFTALNGLATNGTWKLKAVDNANNDTGNIIDFTLTLGSNGITYSWTSSTSGFTSTNQNTSNAPSATTTYTVDATLAGCTGSGTVAVNILPAPAPDASTNAPICSASGLFLFGNNNASGQTTGNTWSWKNPNNVVFSTSQNPSINNATIANTGNYTLTITNTIGCTASATIEAIVNPNPVLSIGTQSNVSCNGLSDGTVNLVATNGALPYLYDLDGNSTVNGTYSGLAAGTHLASVSDDNGCQATSALNVVITQPAVLSFNSSLINESCLGYANGSVTISAAGGTIAYQYSKDNGLNFQISNSFSNLATGNYDLVVKDAHNCVTASALAVVGTTPDVTPPVIINSPVSITKCNDLAPVSWTVPTATDNCTTPVLTSNYNPGDIFPVGVTTVVYTANDGNGNIATSSFNVTVNPLPTVSASDASGCAGNSIALLGTPAGGTWSVANPYTGPSSTYTYTYTDVNGCTNTSAIANITVNPLPTVSASDASGCAGSSIALSGTPAGGTWSVANPYLGPSATYTYTYTDVNGCTNTSSVANITVNPLPTVSASDASGCAGSSIALSGTPAGGTWSVANPYSGPSTTFTYTYTDVNGCTNSNTADITVNSLPIVTASDVSVCIGTSIALSGTPTGGTWSVANPYSGPSTTYTYTYTDVNGCTNTSAVANITVNPLPTVSASDASGCAGNSIALLGSPAGGTWSVANPYTGPSSTYTYTYTDVNGCTNTSAIANITVNPLPTVSASDASGCDGTSIALSGTPTGGAWSVANPYSGPSTTYTYTYTDVNECTNANTAYITVNPLPIVTASDVSVCIGNSIALSGTPAEGTWSVANPYTGPSTTYTYTYSDVNGCTNISAAANITVNSLPTAAISNNNTICIGGSAQLHIDFTGTGPWNYVVSDGIQNISGIAASSSHDMIVIPSTPGNHDYSITSVSDANCNGTSSGSASIFVNAAVPPAGVISSITGTPVAACSGDVAFLTATSASGPGITYSWNNGSGSNPIYYSNSITGPFVPGPFTSSINHVYAQFGVTCCGQSGYHACVKAVNACGSTSNVCSAWVRGNVSVPGFINPTVLSCPNDVKNYSCGPSAGATTYSWTLGGSTVPITSGQGTTNVEVTFPAAFSSASLCVTAALACGGSSISAPRCITISKNPPVPSPIIGTTPICPGATGITYSINAVTGASGYTWSVPAGATITGGQNTPSITVDFPTPYSGAPTVCVTAQNSVCGSGPARCLTVKSGIPNQPASISGPLFNLCGSTGQYSVVSPVAGLTYTWTNPAGTTLSGQGTSTILLAVSSTFYNGNLSVAANSSVCPPATSAARTSSTFWGRPNNPGSITANPDVWCSGGYVNFSIAPASPLPAYTWTVPNGTIDAGQGSNNIDVTWGNNVAGTVSVRASNGCGISAGTSSQVFSAACREEAINASSEVAFSVYPNPAHDNVTLNFNSNEKENVYIDLLDLSGRTVQSVLYDADKGMNKVMIDLKKFSKGAYIVQIKSDKLHQQLPIILQ